MVLLQRVNMSGVKFDDVIGVTIFLCFFVVVFLADKANTVKRDIIIDKSC